MSKKPMPKFKVLRRPITIPGGSAGEAATLYEKGQTFSPPPAYVDSCLFLAQHGDLEIVTALSVNDA